MPEELRFKIGFNKGNSNFFGIVLAPDRTKRKSATAIKLFESVTYLYDLGAINQNQVDYILSRFNNLDYIVLEPVEQKNNN